MRENLSIERLRRLSEATPAQLAAIDLILGVGKVESRTGESENGEQRQVPGMEFAEMLAGIHREIAAVRKDVQEMRTVKEGLEQKQGEKPIGLSGGIDPESLRALCSLLAKGDAAQQSGGTRAERILVRGRLEYRPGLRDVWVGDRHYDLRERTKARLCLEYLVEKQAFDPESARDLVEEIDPYVRDMGNFPRAADIRIDDYFRDGAGRLRGLRRDLIVSAGRNGRYFLRVD